MDFQSDKDIESNPTESLVNAVSSHPLSTGNSSGLMDDQKLRKRSYCEMLRPMLVLLLILICFCNFLVL